jgi:hypothetical protein
MDRADSTPAPSREIDAGGRWRVAQRGALAALFAALGLLNVVRTIIYPEAAAVLLGGAAATFVVAYGLWRETRWGRWIALGLILAPLLNGPVALALGQSLDMYPQFGFYTIAIVVVIGGAVAAAVLVRRESRDQFEPGWSGPMFFFVRTTAVFMVAYSLVAVQDALWLPGGGVPLAAFVGLVVAFMLLAADRVVGVFVAVGALSACAFPDLHAMTASGPSALLLFARTAARYSEGTYLFYGPFSRLAWVPALLSALVASTLVTTAYVRRASKRA